MLSKKVGAKGREKKTGRTGAVVAFAERFGRKFYRQKKVKSGEVNVKREQSIDKKSISDA